MENKDEAMYGMNIRVDAVQMLMNVPKCMSVQQIQWQLHKMSIYSR